MSDFKPENPEIKPTVSEEIARMSPRHWVLSAVLHLVIFGSLLWLTVGKDTVDQSSGAPQELEAVAKSIEESQAAKMRSKVAELLESERKMAELAKEKVENYQTESADRTKQAAQNALEELKNVSEQQASTLQLQDQRIEQARVTIEKITAASLLDDADVEAMKNELAKAKIDLQKFQADLEKLLKEIANQQAKALKVLESMERSIPATAAMKQAAQTQKTVTEALKRATEPETEMRDLLDKLIEQMALAAQEKAATPPLDLATKPAELTPAPSERQKALAAIRASIDRKKSTLQATQQECRGGLAGAKGQQAEASKQLTAAAQAPAPAKVVVFPTPPVTAPSLEHQTLTELYDIARQAEKNLAEDYQKFRAAQLAAILGITLEDAQKSTQSVNPSRERPDPQLPQPASRKSFEKFKVQVLQASQQIDAMTTSGRNLVATAESQRKVGTGQLDAATLQRIEGLALANSSQRGKDLSGIMREIQTSDSARSQGNTGNPSPNESGHAERKFAEAPPRPAPELPNMDYKNIKPLVTRRFGSTGERHADWLAVQSWYVIGPFPNQNRANLHAKFPPESIIDLDAVYPGKDGQPVSWKFRQSDRPMISPDSEMGGAPFVYYAYTELYFEEAHDLWIATGTDDQGVLWVNDLVVWNSGDQFKAWVPNEAYRRVHFSAGKNRLLYRVENGQGTSAFSVLISAKE